MTASGCVAPMAAAIAAAPNFANPFAGSVEPLPTTRALLGLDRQFFVDVGPPAARLLVYVVEPAGAAAPRGTVLVLHGIRASSLWMLGTAHALADAGYRAVLVDLRGHGRSSGQWLTYGPQEAADLSQVIDALAARGLAAGELGVYGISYGATTALHLAGRDSRVRAVVAVAPFDSMREEVPHYWRTFTPGAGRLIADATFQQAIDKAGQVGGFDPDAAVTSDALRGTSAKILILHGAEDWLVPSGNGSSIHRAAPAGCEFALLPELGHTTIWLDSAGEVKTRAKAWFDRHLQPL